MSLDMQAKNEQELSPLQAQIAAEVDVKGLPETYEERWLNILSGGDSDKKARIRGLPLTRLALYGKPEAFDQVNGNKGKPFASRNFAGSNLHKKE